MMVAATSRTACSVKHVLQSEFSDKCQMLFSVAIIGTCVFNLIIAPLVVPAADDWSDVLSTSLTVLQSRVVAVASFVSRGIVLYNVHYDKYRKYKTTLDGFDIYSPMTAAAVARHKLYSLVAVSVCLTFMLPANLVKLYHLYRRGHPDGLLLATHFSFFYLQNLSMYLIENDFANQCYVVYATFRDINDDLDRLKAEQVDRCRFPFLGNTRPRPSSSSSSSCVVVYDKDFYCPRDEARHHHPLTNVVEILKIRHWLSREAVVDINHLFGNHLGLSILSLGVLVLLDVYTGAFHSFTAGRDDDKTMIFRSTPLLFGFILQYSYRFFVITILSNVTAKQAVNAKTLITDINNRYLDTSTQEELQLFYTQISSRCTEFTACDLFTLNTRLITSAIAAGATYLVILVQFHSGKN